MDYFDLIEHLAERSWFEQMLSMTRKISTIELFVTLAVSCHKELRLRCCRVLCSVVGKPDKTMIFGVRVMFSTTSLYFCI